MLEYVFNSLGHTGLIGKYYSREKSQNFTYGVKLAERQSEDFDDFNSTQKQLQKNKKWQNYENQSFQNSGSQRQRTSESYLLKKTTENRCRSGVSGDLTGDAPIPLLPRSMA